MRRLNTQSQMQPQQYQVAYRVPYEDGAGSLGKLPVFWPCGEVKKWVGQSEVKMTLKLNLYAACQ